MNLVYAPEILAMALGVLLAIAWLALLLLASIWTHVWRWIDDGDSGQPYNPIVHRVMALMGYTRGRDSDYYPYQKKVTGRDSDISCGWIAVTAPLFALLLTPIAAVICFHLYPLTIAAVTLFLMARIARFARRHKKLFDKHLKDPSAHK